MPEYNTMNCVYCGRELPFPECFPDRGAAECWSCAWDEHIRQEHRRLLRKVRRQVRRRSRERNEASDMAAAYEWERRLLSARGRRDA